MSDVTTAERQFIQEYVETRAYDDDYDTETLRKNGKKYATSLFGTNVSRMGWFDWLEERKGKSAEEATVKDVRGFLLYLEEQGLSSPTRTQARSGLSLYYQVMDIDCENPVEQLEGSWRSTTNKEKATGEKRSHPTREEIQLLVDNAPSPSLRSTLVLKLLYQTGCRRMELATMQVDNISIEEQEIKVYGDKADEWRKVTFRKSLQDTLNIWINGPRRDEVGYHKNNPYLFPAASTRGETDHISGQVVRDTVHNAAVNAGIQDTYGDGDVNGQNQYKITPHSLRHAFAVHSADNGVPAPHLKEILGHHSLDITQIYANIAEDKAVDMMKNRGPSLSE